MVVRLVIRASRNLTKAFVPSPDVQPVWLVRSDGRVQRYWVKMDRLQALERHPIPVGVKGYAALTLPKGDAVFEGARKVVRTLRDAGYECWITGGAVRNMLMGRPVHDYDIVTSARPEEVQKVFPKTVPVGAKFGVIVVHLPGHGDYEVATYRTEFGYADGRRPGEVRYATSLKEDHDRRDFTMNSLVMDPETGLVLDMAGGLEDIRRHTIRTIGDPRLRFAEDHLRAMRAIRFAAQFGFEIEKRTWEAVREYAPALRRISRERIRDEVGKILDSARPGLGLQLLVQSGVLDVIAPEVAQNIQGRVKEVADALDALRDAGPLARWAVLAWHTADPRRFMHGLKHAGDARERVGATVDTAHAIQHLPDPDMAVEKRVLRRDEARDALAVLRALGLSPEAVKHAEERLRRWTRESMFPPRLVTGDDLIAAGMKPGPAIGEALRRVEDEWLRGHIRTRAEAMHMLFDSEGT